jgi:hypothetical protein
MGICRDISKGNLKKTGLSENADITLTSSKNGLLLNGALRQKER